ncbi:MAG: twin-arginine translocase subunit TatC [Chloroflexi bacterium]|nr:twin-arginine translocase subunit TatC [Chloroflexota bacterium]
MALTKSDKADNGEKRLTLMGHLEELRQRLIKSVIAVGVGTAISFMFTQQIFQLLKSRAEGVELIYTEVPELLGTYIKVAFVSGLVLAMPVLVYQLVMFVAPALTPKEKRWLYLLMPGVVLSFITGAAFAFFLVIPPALKFLLTFGIEIAKPQIKVGNYVSVVTNLVFYIGLAFEAPLIVYFLAKIRIIKPRLLTRYRKYAFVGAFVAAAFITPTPDPINQSLVAVPLIALYEVSILLAKLAWRGVPQG